MWGWNESGQLGFPCSHEDKQTQEFVNILTIPTLLEIRSSTDSQETPQKLGREGTSGTTEDELMVQKVACGSRHTVCLTGTANHICLSVDYRQKFGNFYGFGRQFVIKSVT